MFPNNVVRFIVLLTISVLSATGAYAQYYAITGTHTSVSPSGARPARRNILDIQNDTPTWSLYIQALTTLQSINESDQLSYFQIAGIHGRPFIPWNTINQVGDPVWGGYCFHSSVLFLTWHRPYLALYEQLLASHVQVIAQTYDSTPLAATYQAAANNFRIPYWDWASVPTMPAVVSQQYVQITTPSGVQTMENPLYQYKFKTFPLNPTYFPPGTSGDGPLANDSYTIRGASQPSSGDNPDAVNKALGQQNLMSNTYKILTKQITFDAFCTTATSGNAIEGVHDTIHGCIGQQYGHMSWLTYSAFDPIFWLHHANIDRLFAIWQSIYYTEYLTEMIEAQGTFAIPRGNQDTMNTLLQPFSSTSGEIQDWNQTPGQLQQNVTAAINGLYNPQGIPTKRAATPSGQTKEWSVSLNVSKYDLDGQRFIIQVFLGPIPENPEDWPFSNRCVGSFSVFPPPYTGTRPYPAIIAYSEIDLTKGLSENGVDETDVEAVEEWLTNNLSWRVQKFDLSPVPNNEVPSLHLVVQDEDVTLPKDITELPTYGKPTLHPVATQGK